MKRIKLRPQRRVQKYGWIEPYDVTIHGYRWRCPYCERAGLVEEPPGQYIPAGETLWDRARMAAVQHIVAKHVPPASINLKEES